MGNPETTSYQEVTNESKEIAELMKGSEGIFFYDENNNEIKLGSNEHFQYMKKMHDGITDDFAWQEVKLDVINTVKGNLDTRKNNAEKIIKEQTRAEIQEIKNEYQEFYGATTVENTYIQKQAPIVTTQETSVIEETVVVPETIVVEQPTVTQAPYTVNESYGIPASEQKNVFAQSKQEQVEDKNTVEKNIDVSIETNDTGTINDLRELFNDNNLGNIEFSLYSGKWTYYTRGDELSTLKTIPDSISKTNIGELRLMEKIVKLQKEISYLPDSNSNYNNNVNISSSATVIGNVTVNGINISEGNGKNEYNQELNELLSDYEAKRFDKYKTLDDY